MIHARAALVTGTGGPFDRVPKGLNGTMNEPGGDPFHSQIPVQVTVGRDEGQRDALRGKFSDEPVGRTVFRYRDRRAGQRNRPLRATNTLDRTFRPFTCCASPGPR